MAIFLLLSALAHFYPSTIGYTSYVANLERKKNPIRFFEYALSSSVMIIVIALLVGIYELAALIASLGVNAAMNLFGNSMEDDNEHAPKTRWTSFVYGCVAGLVPWIVNMVLQYKKIGPWKEYLYGEGVYIVLSLSAKTVLAWIIFSGTLAPV